MRQFAQRISSAFHLRAMDADTVRAYVGGGGGGDHRLRVAGAMEPIFRDDACALIHTTTAGVPRLVNQLCDLAMVCAFIHDRDAVDTVTVQQVIDEGAFFAAEEPRSAAPHGRHGKGPAPGSGYLEPVGGGISHGFRLLSVPVHAPGALVPAVSGDRHRRRPDAGPHPAARLRGAGPPSGRIRTDPRRTGPFHRSDGSVRTIADHRTAHPDARGSAGTRGPSKHLRGRVETSERRTRRQRDRGGSARSHLHRGERRHPATRAGPGHLGRSQVPRARRFPRLDRHQRIGDDGPARRRDHANPRGPPDAGILRAGDGTARP